MAKTAAPPTERRMPEPAELPPLSTKTQRVVDSIRAQFQTFVSDFAALTESRQELAPRFMKAFATWQSETGSTFVAFVRVLVPELPDKRESYRSHPAFQAADYLRRLAGRPAERKPINRAEMPATPLDVVGRLVAAILPLVGDQAALWAAFSRDLHWTEQQVHRLQSLVQHSEPLLRGPEHVTRPVFRMAA